ncbi:isoprenoid biosynthesis protein ElbB [Desulfobacter hydrogenophilus]|uniref:Isoprenoid biosynthesis glyoxalase ElbB n=1 Tax=Desulfobacter hydrogenophilus TaxID=2291 RepID=A0A328FG04_9BACT|nr:isoprenoid biosynthesis glyoxalase ElbB [Desulfobacter hydrogenophilus]NDY72054.1 isoprenoid biosynthesis glyoxalase ElbB [Desulfobacter hydrogenophilus]QBH11476.1 isoprenoid biosynthesis glyoxalase ElbB [Desulfobacter hydrogenophilus]RAM01975.1 isoprenoid biosynthesis protein ElbB [Desulfobacter hydrogenophilus]
MGKKIGVLLAGCGVYDGSEIQEAVLTMLYLDQAHADIICMAPNMEQYHVIDHLSGTETAEKRNVLVESARIARGEIKDLKDVQASDMDAIIIPGGFGAAKNLSDFAINNVQAKVHPEVQRIITDMINSKKPVGALCIAPATLTKIIADKQPEVTIGNDIGTADAIKKMGGKHVTCAVDQTHIDKDNKIVTTPAYMLGPNIKDVAVGIEKLVAEVLAMI